jgi:hypothetical protein
MRVTLTNNGEGIGYLDFEVINWYDSLGELRNVVTTPPQLGRIIEQKIKTNAFSVAVSGGDMPPDLSNYWDGIVATLNKIKTQAPGFDYLVPSGQDPLKEENTPEKFQRRIR